MAAPSKQQPSSKTVTDPTDWLPTALPSLAAVDAGLRCQVCKDFFTTPVTTSCAHTFCSLCIRRCLAQDNGRCPACRTEDQPSKLRRNGALQEVVDAFVQARAGVLDVASRPAGPAEDGGTRSEPNEEEGRPTRRSERNAKRKLGETDLEGKNQTKETRSRARRVGNVIPNSQDSQDSQDSAPEVIDLEDEEPAPSKRSAKDEDEEYTPEDGLVPCPICRKRMKEEAVFLHLDRCGQEPAPTPSSKTAFPSFSARGPTVTASTSSPPPTHIPHLNPSLLNDGALRKKLRELGISSNGPRQLQIRRHAEWVNLWNANCDAVRPRTKRELLADLDQWDRSQGGAVSAMGAAFGQRNSGGEVMAKDFDADAYGKKNKDHFGDLIAKARAGRKKAVEKSEDDTADHADATGNDDSKLGEDAGGDPATLTDDPRQMQEGIEREIKDRLPDAETASKEGPTPLPARLADDSVKKVPLFEAPDDPIMDVDGEMTHN